MPFSKSTFLILRTFRWITYFFILLFMIMIYLLVKLPGWSLSQEIMTPNNGIYMYHHGVNGKYLLDYSIHTSMIYTYIYIYLFVYSEYIMDSSYISAIRRSDSNIWLVHSFAWLTRPPVIYCWQGWRCVICYCRPPRILCVICGTEISNTVIPTRILGTSVNNCHT